MAKWANLGKDKRAGIVGRNEGFSDLDHSDEAYSDLRQLPQY